MSFRLFCRLDKAYKGVLGAVAVLSLFSYTASATGAYLAGTPDNDAVTTVNSSENQYVRYVTTTGDDANDGFTTATAKATLQAAIDSLDAHSQEHDCTVYLYKLLRVLHYMVVMD